MSNMKNQTIIKILLTILCLCNIAEASTVVSYNTIYQDDIVNIESCDKYGWCKIQNQDLYIRKFKFDSSDGIMYIMINKNNTYYYTKGKKKKNLVGYLYGYNRSIINNTIVASQDQTKELEEEYDENNIPQDQIEDKRALREYDEKIKFQEKVIIQKDYRYSAIHQDDIVNIESCDKYGWCKIQNQDLYIRKFKFSSLNGIMYIMINEKDTYYYVKTGKKESLYGYSIYSKDLFNLDRIKR